MQGQPRRHPGLRDDAAALDAALRTVCAVVADTGGILTHCAIVAREYRIPCVVGTAFGTAVIKDGMMLTVDGSKGIVRIESA